MTERIKTIGEEFEELNLLEPSKIPPLEKFIEKWTATPKYVYIVECECEDSYYSPYLVDIFSTLELATQFVENIDKYSRYMYSISRSEVKDKL